jgi:hypothetical protein
MHIPSNEEYGMHRKLTADWVVDRFQQSGLFLNMNN